MMEMGLRVKVEKLLLVLHIRSLEEETLAKKVYNEQKQQNWPGLAKEAEEICKFLEIEDVNTTSLNKKEFKKLVKDACEKKDEDEIRHSASSKCENIMKDKYGKKEYLAKHNIHKSRQYFRTRVNMHRFAGNFSHDRTFARTGWLCRCGLAREEVAHLTSGTCPTYQNIFEKFDDLSCDEELVKFYSEILARRDAIDEEQ